MTKALVVALICLAPRLASAQLGAKPSSIVIDAGSGNVLEATNADERRYPASLTKLMTLYLTFEALRSHRITLHRLVPVSAHAASREPTKLWLAPGTRVSVEQCILGMVTVSANDAAAAMGELLGGSEYRFGHMMTSRAHRLGMTRSVFHNASGLPDPAQVTTARDMATLARALIRDFPQYYHYFSVTSFVFHGRTIHGHNAMLGTYEGADGLKTGFTSAAGYNLATSARRHGARIIGIVLGAPNIPQRHAKMISLLDQGFSQFAPSIELTRAGIQPTGIQPTGIQPTGARPTRTEPPEPRLIRVAEAAEPAPSPTPPSHSHPRDGYTVQVGTFTSHRAALRAVRVAVGTVGGVAHVQRFAVHGKAMWRGRVTSLTHAGALRLCPAHPRKAHRCLIIEPPHRHPHHR